MITFGTLVIGTTIHFMAIGTTGVQATAEPPSPPINPPAATKASTPAVPAGSIEMTTPAPPPAPAVPPARPAAPAPVPAPAQTPPTAEAAPPAWPTDPPKAAINERAYDLRDFNAVLSIVNVHVSVEEGPWSVSANGDSEQMERLDMKVENGALRINVRQDKPVLRSRNMGKVNVVVRMPQVARLELYGSGRIRAGELGAARQLAVSVLGWGDIDLMGVKAVDELTLLVQGSGDINCLSAVVSGRTTATVMGSGDIKAGGSTGSLEVLIQGSGDVDLTAMRAQSGKVTILGSGDASVHCTGTLERLIMGSGTLRNVAGTGAKGAGVPE